MNLDSHILLRLTACFLMSMVWYAAAAQSAPTPAAQPKETRLTDHARGPFDVKTTAQALSEKVADPTLGRMSLDKQYHGDLEASGKGEMLTVSTGVKGSGVYVAVERVTGTLQGRKGSFALYHTGVMTRGTPELRITVVPDSGTDQLAGIAGTLSIQIENGKHSYDLEYTLPESK
jgi:hypothetical protein